MKIVTIVGARPQFIKAAPLSRELRKHHKEFLLQTGQHYDQDMSGVFFSELGIPAPDANLGVGSSRHGAQTAAMLEGIERILIAEQPDWVIVYGDTNSTLAGALAAAKIRVPIAHVEAGLRSFNRRMPEEVNRVVTDHLAQLNLCPSTTAVANLEKEGITDNVHLVGDIMSDALTWGLQSSQGIAHELLSSLQIAAGHFLLCTVHRSENTDDPERLAGIVDALNRLDERVVLPLHPRTGKAIEATRLQLKPHVRAINPIGYVQMIALASTARMILTDSGGLQKEAYWLGVPCVTLRDETEWVETVSNGWNLLAGASADRVVDAVRGWSAPIARPQLYGDGGVAARCVSLLRS